MLVLIGYYYQPTDPLRETNEIIQAIEIGLNTKCDSVISVERVYSHHPALMKKIINNKIVPFLINEIEGTTRQTMSRQLICGMDQYTLQKEIQ